MLRNPPRLYRLERPQTTPSSPRERVIEQRCYARSCGYQDPVPILADAVKPFAVGIKQPAKALSTRKAADNTLEAAQTGYRTAMLRLLQLVPRLSIPVLAVAVYPFSAGIKQPATALSTRKTVDDALETTQTW